ncbi:MAG TPA: hypothetical protein PKD00_03080 [Burkholderiales bacterium]|nr:hypothetical protein [Burkholderiales bacterium]
MKTIEEEARQYFDNVHKRTDDKKTAWDTDNNLKEFYIERFTPMFVAGANSKYVQAEKVKVQIELIEKFENTKFFGQDCRDYFKKEKKQLQLQLKEYE